jgi:ligand-binding sensor domain-containing protein
LFVRKSDGTLKNIVIENHHKLNKIVQIDNEIWLATDGNGIIILDEDLNYLRALKRGQNNDQTLRSNSIYDIFKGINHKIWVASFGAGLTCILHENLLFTNIVPEKGNPNSLVASEGISVFENNGMTYLGTNYGMSILDESKKIFTNFSTDQLQRDLGGVKVHGICIDGEKNMWIGTYDGLLGKYSSTFRFLKSFHPCSNNSDEMQKIVMMYNYNNTNLLIGTQYQNRSLMNFDLKTEKVYTLGMMVDGVKVNHFQINSIRENQKGEILILDSRTGLYKVNFKENKLEDSFLELNKEISFWRNDFYNDKSGN